MTHVTFGVFERLRNLNKEIVGKVLRYSGGRLWENIRSGFPS